MIAELFDTRIPHPGLSIGALFAPDEILGINWAAEGGSLSSAASSLGAAFFSFLSRLAGLFILFAFFCLLGLFALVFVFRLFVGILSLALPYFLALFLGMLAGILAPPPGAARLAAFLAHHIRFSGETWFALGFHPSSAGQA